MLRVLAVLATCLLAFPLRAECVGSNLLDALAPQDRAQISAAANAAPHAQGLLWQAQRGDQRLTLVGTYHMPDARHAAILEALEPHLAAASLLLVEAGPQEEAALRAEMTRNPALIFATSGPTLAERLPEADWQRLAQALRDRGIPPFLGSRFRPWYAAVTLALSPCAMAEAAAGKRGLDAEVIARAGARGLPVRALEPHDTLFTIFDEMSEADQLDMIRASLPMADRADDYTTTLAEAYFAEEPRLIWEFSRYDALANSGLAPQTVAAQFAMTEDLMMNRRNRAWIAVIEAALAEGTVMLAAGALHLPGEGGLLALLHAKGFQLERLPLVLR